MEVRPPRLKEFSAWLLLGELFQSLLYQLQFLPKRLGLLLEPSGLLFGRSRTPSGGGPAPEMKWSTCAPPSGKTAAETPTQSAAPPKARAPPTSRRKPSSTTNSPQTPTHTPTGSGAHSHGPCTIQSRHFQHLLPLSLHRPRATLPAPESASRTSSPDSLIGSPEIRLQAILGRTYQAPKNLHVEGSEHFLECCIYASGDHHLYPFLVKQSWNLVWEIPIQPYHLPTHHLVSLQLQDQDVLGEAEPGGYALTIPGNPYLHGFPSQPSSSKRSAICLQ